MYLLDLIHGHSILEPWACFGVENVIVRVVARGCPAHIPSYELGWVVGLSYHGTQCPLRLKSVILSECFFFNGKLLICG